MSSLPLETTEPDPAATSISNDETVNKENTDDSAPTDTTAIETSAPIEKDAAVEDVATKEANGSADKVTEESKETPASGEAKEKNGNGARTYTSHKNPKLNGVLMTTATVDGKNNSKYDPSTLQPTDDPVLIRAQVEFYFSDTNLPTDKFMWELTKGAENAPIQVKKLCSFGRMKRFQPYSAVITALKQSKFLSITGEEGAEMVARKIAYDPTTPQSASEARSIYAKGFGDEVPTSQFDIEAFFTPYGPINAVRLRRTSDKLFKGSVFVEFQDEDLAKKFLELDPKPMWKGKHILMVESKVDYCGRKNEELREGTKQAQTQSYRGGRGRGRGGRGRGDRDRSDRDRGDRDPNDWKKRREEDRASGFKDNRGRGGRGRGGNNKGRRDDRGSRPNDRNRERENDKDSNGNQSDKKAEVKTEESANDKKRAREDDGEGQAPAKKVDTKPEVAAETS